MDKKLRQLEEEQRRLMDEIEKNNRRINSNYGYRERGKGSLLEFFIGLLLLGAGLFWVFQSVRVSSSWWGGSLCYFGWGMPNGTVVIPLLIGIIMLFMMKRKIFGWIVVSIGVLIILLSVISSVSLYFVSQSLFSYILMFGFVAVGAALVLKSLFSKH